MVIYLINIINKHQYNVVMSMMAKSHNKFNKENSICLTFSQQ